MDGSRVSYLSQQEEAVIVLFSSKCVNVWFELGSVHQVRSVVVVGSHQSTRISEVLYSDDDTSPFSHNVYIFQSCSALLLPPTLKCANTS